MGTDDIVLGDLDSAGHDVLKRGNQESRRLSRSGLRARHQVPPLQGNGNGVLLNGGGFVIPAPGDVVLQQLAEWRLGELQTNLSMGSL